MERVFGILPIMILILLGCSENSFFPEPIASQFFNNDGIAMISSGFVFLLFALFGGILIAWEFYTFTGNTWESRDSIWGNTYRAKKEIIRHVNVFFGISISTAFWICQFFSNSYYLYWYFAILIIILLYLVYIFIKLFYFLYSINRDINSWIKDISYMYRSVISSTIKSNVITSKQWLNRWDTWQVEIEYMMKHFWLLTNTFKKTYANKMIKKASQSLLDKMDEQIQENQR